MAFNHNFHSTVVPQPKLLFSLRPNLSSPYSPQLVSSRSLKPRWWTSQSTSSNRFRLISTTRSRRGCRSSKSSSYPKRETTRSGKTRIASILRWRSSKLSLSRHHWWMNFFRATWVYLIMTSLSASRSCTIAIRMPGTTTIIAPATGNLSESQTQKTRGRRPN